MICLSFGDLLTLVKFNAVKNVSFSLEYSSVFFPPHCFIAAGHFPMLSWRDQRGCIDIHPTLTFMKGKSFTSGEKRHCFFPDTICPPSPARGTHPHTAADFTFIAGRGNGCLCAPVCKCAFEVGHMKASSSV